MNKILILGHGESDLANLITENCENAEQFNFEESFSKYFTIERMLPIDDSLRTLYWMKKK